MIYELRADDATASVRIKAAVDGAVNLWMTRSYKTATQTVTDEPVRVMWPWKDGQALSVRDFECPMDYPVTYTMWGTDEAGKQIGDKRTLTVTLGDRTGDWLRPVTRPLSGMRLWVEAYNTVRRDGRIGTFDVMGRDDRIAVTAKRGLPSGTLQLLTLTESERDRILNILNSGEPVMFLSPKKFGVGKQYLAVKDVTETRLSPAGWDWARRWTLDVEEIGYPAGSTSDFTFMSWATLRQTEATWKVVGESYDTWADVPEVVPFPPPDPGDE